MNIKRERPTSPHLGIYRWQISNTLSILHRLTGVALNIGMLLFTWWIIFSIYSNYNSVIVRLPIFDSIIFRIMLFGWSFAFFYHLMNGIRHLFWDAGYGFELKTTKISGIFVMSFSIFLTLISWIMALKLI